MPCGRAISFRRRIDRLAASELERFKRIRLAALRDSPAAFGTTFARASARTDSEWSRLYRSIVVFVAVLNDDDVGMIRGGVEDGAASLGSLWVRSESRQRGIASALLAEIMAWAAAEGHEEISLQVGIHQEPARRLYEMAGFVAVGEPLAYPSPQNHLLKISMVRSL